MSIFHLNNGGIRTTTIVTARQTFTTVLHCYLNERSGNARQQGKYNLKVRCQ